jgi:hypothetical protein
MNIVLENLFGEVISIYTRAQGIEDGVLVDVSEMAKEAGFKFPVAVTARLWSIINTIPKAYSYQDKTGRLWDVLFMAALYAKRNSGTFIYYTLNMHHEVETEKGKRIRKNLDLKVMIGPGDKYEPVITIMLPYED